MARLGVSAIGIIVFTSTLLAAPPEGARLVQAEDFADRMTPAQRAAIELDIAANLARLDFEGKLASRTQQLQALFAPQLQWPLRATSAFRGFDYHGVSNFVDHDAQFPGHVRDFNCGARSYDNASGYNHAGTDYFLWPFAWLMMDQEQVDIVAAAPGTIAAKSDGNFDRNCAMGSGTWNAVYVRHTDGSVAWYGHMKNGTLTPKAIGDTVVAGDYLGKVGSSGSSTAPHLHFELHDVSGNIVDPHHGSCNASAELWAVLQPYEDPGIDSLSLHSAAPDFVDCGTRNGMPVQETANYQESFQPGEPFFVFASYRDHRNGEVTQFRMLRPDGSIFSQWDFDLADQSLPRPFYAGTEWFWSFRLPADAAVGEWTVQATFVGHDYAQAFLVGNAAQIRAIEIARARAAVGALASACRFPLGQTPPAVCGRNP